MSAAKLCDSCKSASATVFCRADSAFLCIGCDSKIHAANKLASRHARVWVCEVCEQAPATVTCKADAAHLCPTCDRDIHSANPLARRHERVPLSPFYDPAAAADSSAVKSTGNGSAAALKSAAINKLFGEEDYYSADDLDAEEAEAASWLLPNPNTNVNPNMNGKTMDVADPKSIDYLFADDDIDPYLDLDFSSDPKPDPNSAGADCVVPDQKGSHYDHHHQQHHQQQPAHSHSLFSMPSFNNHQFDGFDSPANFKPFPISYAQPALSHSVSSSSMDVGVVPDTSTAAMGDVASAGVGGLEKQMALARGGGVDREARVMRYREKRKNRKFEKTIRYASRKAYAETRPRIKGRFAKRTDVESVDRTGNGGGVDCLFSADAGYGVVPSF